MTPKMFHMISVKVAEGAARAFIYSMEQQGWTPVTVGSHTHFEMVGVSSANYEVIITEWNCFVRVRPVI